MATYEIKYRLSRKPDPATDGGGQIGHEVLAIAQDVANGGFFLMPGHNRRVILVPAAELTTVMDMPDATGPEKTAKNGAYKDLLVAHRDDAATPLDTGWNPGLMQQYLQNNDLASEEAGRADTYIRLILDQTYPLDFGL